MNQPAQKAVAISPVTEIRQSLNAMESQFQAALPEHVTPEKFVRTVMTCVQNEPKLVAATRQTLYAACLECATDGLLPDGREAAIVPFNGKNGLEAVYMPMVGGLLKMMRNSGELSSITPNIVCEKDEFEYWFDDEGEHIKHKPFLGGPRGEITHAYAIARNKDGSKTFEVMSKIEIDAVRESSKAKDSGPWKEWYGEMAKKTVIRRISKRLAMSTEIERAVHRDDALYDLDKKETKTDAPRKSRLDGIVEANVPASLEIEHGSSVPGDK